MHRRNFIALSALTTAAAALPNLVQATTILPAIPEKLKDNPLLQFGVLPNFADAKPEHLNPAIDYLLANYKEVVLQAGGVKNPTWNNFYYPLESAANLLGRAWHVANHLQSVMDSDALREAFEKAESKVTDFYTWLGMNRPIYENYLKLKNSPAYATYSQAQKQSINNALRDFELSGIKLTGKDAEEFAKIQARLSELSTKFSNNVLDSVDGYELIITDEGRLAGISDDAKHNAAESAKAKGKQGWRFTLNYPSYSAVVRYADDRELRRTMYEAYYTRASDRGPNKGKWDNTPVINEILKLRTQMAHLLGFKTFAHYALVTRMAKTPETVINFLTEIAAKAQDGAKKETDVLREYGKKFGINDLKPWDTQYLSEKYQKEYYDLDNDALRVYFPENKVVAGLFEIIGRLYGVRFTKRADIRTWHPDVRCFEVRRGNDLVAFVYMDLYARENKQGGAWMDSAIDRRISEDGTQQLPVAQIVCNFTKPVDGKPSLLLHDEVTTLFHEMGHALHLMLTQIDVMAVSGINGVAWDAVEFPSQMFENWTWKADALKLVSAHTETGEPLPQATIDKLLAAKNYNAARGIIRQLELALFDFKLNLEYTPNRDNLKAVNDELRKSIGMLEEPEWVRIAHSFGHIFSGGYAAGYYSYMWADVLAHDGFTRFAKEGIFNRATGQSFVDNFSGRGGSEEAMQLYINFMGRKPQLEPMLRDYGII